MDIPELVTSWIQARTYGEFVGGILSVVGYLVVEGGD
jgi:hypothetical protein